MVTMKGRKRVVAGGGMPFEGRVLPNDEAQPWSGVVVCCASYYYSTPMVFAAVLKSEICFSGKFSGNLGGVDKIGNE
ncbi:hypothetical protein Ancab_019062 [Ancistrocladus abbreviatus]